MIRFKTLFGLAAVAALSVSSQAQTALILDGTVTGGAASIEAAQCIVDGVGVEVVSDAGWTAKTAADFAGYRAIVLGDPTCLYGITPSIAAATANNTVWGPQIDGNTIIIGTDERFHSTQGGLTFNNSAIDFVLADATKTGALISLSCYYDSTAFGTPVPLLDGLLAVTPGAFTVRGTECYNDAHIVAIHPALSGSTDATLSNWSCSVHEAFVTWQDSGSNPFVVLVIAENLGATYTAPDGTVGTPYVLARGAGLVVDSDISLSPAFGPCHPINSDITLTATVSENGVPVVGTLVTFTVTSGPCAGATGNGITNGAGQVTFTYSCGTIGFDNVIAQFTDSTGVTQTSNVAIVEWCETECYLVLGRGAGASAWTIGTSTFITQLASVRSYWVVTMADNPSLRVPNLPAGAVLSFSTEILMRNPLVFPTNPDQWSQRLRVIITPGQVVTGELHGTLNGINIGLQTFTDPLGEVYMRFPFTVNGM